MKLETFTIKESYRFLLTYGLVGIVAPAVYAFVFWPSDGQFSPYIIVFSFLFYMGVVYYFWRRRSPSRIHVEGSRLLLKTLKGDKELDIVADQVRFHVAFVRIRSIISRRRRSSLRYELRYGSDKEERVIFLNYFAYKDANRLNLYLGQFSYEADKEWEVFPIFDLQESVRSQRAGMFIGAVILVAVFLPFFMKLGFPVEWVFLFLLMVVVLYFLLFLCLRPQRKIPKSLVFEEEALVIDGHRFVLSNLKLARIAGLKRGALGLLLVDQEGKKYRFYLGFDSLRNKEGYPAYPPEELLEKQFRKYYYDGHLADLELVYWNEITT